MTPQELKSSILNLAFQGKLTQQQENDTPIDNLIRDCCEDKADAIAKGKYKKEAFRGSVVCDDYDIPEAWRIMHISDMSLFQEGPGILSVDFRPQGIPLIRIAGMKTERLSLEGCNFLDPEMVKGKWSHFKLDLGDIVISTSASMDKVCEVYDDCVGAIPYTGQIRFKMYGGINKEYFKWFIQSPFYIRQINEQKAGAAIKHYGPTHLKKMTIPIAPLEEQKRIVERIEELLPLIDRYEQAWTKLEAFNKRFPSDMQKSLLQIAIQGKLVEQRADEGTGEELFKSLSVYHKGLKPCKNELNFSSMDFDLPDSWRMVELNQLFDFVDYRGKTPHKINEGVFLITASNIKQGYMDYTRKEYISREEYNGRQSRGITQKGDLLFTTEAPMGNAALCDLDECSCGQRIITFKEYKEQTAFSSLFMYFILSPPFQQQLLDNCTGTTAKGIKADKLKHFLIPLPPYAEQKRIVAKLEEILPLCEKLK
ncbi:MAG: restriction endonuclease subunit S [Clostridiales bacterium]|nr:restriction endonuclease subunit S [Clostridiales bacterium]